MQSEKAVTTIIARLVILLLTRSGEMPILNKQGLRQQLIVRQTELNVMLQARRGRKQTLKKLRLGASVTAKKKPHIYKTNASDIVLAKPIELLLGLPNLTGSKYNAGIRWRLCTTRKVLSDGVWITSFRCTGKMFLASMFQAICESSSLTKTNERPTNMLSNNIITALTARVEALEGTQP